MNYIPLHYPTIEAARDALWRDGVVHYVLEPGDATRYTLLCARYGMLVWVVRTHTGGSPDSEAIGACCVRMGGFVPEFAVTPLANGNAHTARVLATFLSQLTLPPADGDLRGHDP